jgi:putative component of toxin-antitoxin plasmid stabilization module
MEQGNFSNVKGVGAGVYKYRTDFSPGYRIYFGKDADVAAAKGHWSDYKRRKRQEVT